MKRHTPPACASCGEHGAVGLVGAGGKREREKGREGEWRLQHKQFVREESGRWWGGVIKVLVSELAIQGWALTGVVMWCASHEAPYPASSQ